ncbi:MAG: alpha/beta hydrolase [Bacteroidia bacterium]
MSKSTFDIYTDAIREFISVPGIAARMVMHDEKLPPMEQVRYGPHKRNHLIVYEAASGVKARKEIIYFIHGGGWRMGSPHRRRLLVKLFTDMGYIVMMPTYRLAPTVSFPEIHEDAFRGFKEAQHHPFAEGRKFILMGESAGGSLGAFLAYDKKAQEQSGIDVSSILGLISVVGVLDMEPMPDTFVVRDYAGERDSDLFKKSNPISLLTSDVHIPVLAIHGDDDGLVPHASAENFIKAINRLNTGLGEFHLVANGTHMGVATDWYLEDNYTRKVILNWIMQLSMNDEQ